jgi:membrane-bound ClpP family serine protease
MVAVMAKKTESGAIQPRADDRKVTTVKCYSYLARTITILAKTKGMNQQDLMDTYLKRFEEDLVAATANRRAESRESRKGIT